jgi:hypothetical protein
MESDIREKIKTLQLNIEHLRSRFPAHSIPAAMLVELDQLDEELNFWMTQLSSSESIKPDVPEDGIP